jgi:RNA polymerase sigma factor (sigma-70 family)
LEASAIHAPSGLGRITAHGPLLRLRSDDQLVALFRMGYDEAFRTIHDRYRQRLFAYTRQMLSGSRSDAEDVLQDVFLRAYGALRNDDRPVTLRAWLYRVAHNRCIDHLRRPVPAAAEVYELSRTPTHDPPDETQRREELRRLVQDVQRLPEQQRSALLMRELDGLSYAELADALRTTIPAIKSLLVRARIGLVEAGEARDAACAEIRSDLALAHRRGVRASGRSRRHLRDCAGCRDYRRAMRTLERGFAALAPAGGGGPWATLAKLLGIGGASSGAAASAGVGGSAAVVGGATATKVAAIVCCAAVVGGGAVEVRDHVTGSAAPHRRAAQPARAAAASTPSAAAAVVIKAPVSRAAATLGGHAAPAARRKPARHRTTGTEKKAAATPAVAAAPAAPEEIQTGGAMAPEEDPAAAVTPATGTEEELPATEPAAPAAEPPPAVDAAPGDPAAGEPSAAGGGGGAGAGGTGGAGGAGGTAAPGG